MPINYSSWLDNNGSAKALARASASACSGRLWAVAAITGAGGRLSDDELFIGGDALTAVSPAKNR